MKDAIGQFLAIGDSVAYVSRAGSRIHIERRVILSANDSEGTVRLSRGENQTRDGGDVQAYNVVKVAP